MPHLARFSLYNYLYGRTFLFSCETLLEGLRILEKTRFMTHKEVYDAERFEEFH